MFTQIEVLPTTDGTATVVVSGEVDLASAPELRDTITRVAAERPADEHHQHREGSQQATGLHEVGHALVLPVRMLAAESQTVKQLASLRAFGLTRGTPTLILTRL